MSPLPLGPPTVESVMSLLWGVAGRWKEIAEGLEFDEDLIDEIDTNNDMNEGCLQVCVEIWVTKLQPSWKKLSRALKELGEEELACQALNKGSVLMCNTCQRLFPTIGMQSHKSSGRHRVGRPVTQAQVELVHLCQKTEMLFVLYTVADASVFGEVLPGVKETVAPDDVNNQDGSRGGKVCP